MFTLFEEDYLKLLVDRLENALIQTFEETSSNEPVIGPIKFIFTHKQTEKGPFAFHKWL